MADGYGYDEEPGVGVLPYGASGGANILAGALPGLNRTAQTLGSIPLLMQQAQLMAERQALQGTKSLIEILKLPGAMSSAALEHFGPQLGINPGLVATLKKGKEEDRRRVAAMIEEAGIGTGADAQVLMKVLQDDPIKAFEFARQRLEEKDFQRRRQAAGLAWGDPLPVIRPEPTRPEPGPLRAVTEPTTPVQDPMREAPPAVPPPPPPPGVAGPAGSIAPGPTQRMPTETGGGPDWQRAPGYVRAKTRYESALQTIDNINRGFAVLTSTAKSKADEDRIDAERKGRLENAKEALDSARKDLEIETPAYAGHVEVRDPISGKTVIRAIGKRGETLGTIGNAPLKPSSPIGQLTEDYHQAVDVYGSESQRAKDIRRDIDLRLDTSQAQLDKAKKELEQTGQLKETDKHNLRNEFTKHSERFVIIRDGFRNLMSAVPGPVGDMDMVFAIMKMFDPTSVVRETEYASAKNARGVPESIRNMWNHLKDGDILTEEQRQSFRAQAANIYGTQLKSHRQLVEQYRGIARRAGANPDDIVVEFPMSTEEPRPAGSGRGTSGSWEPGPSRTMSPAGKAATVDATRAAQDLRSALDALTAKKKELDAANARGR